mmetsp:Transcript_10806/g.16271  ORF Transcript_10806/g.16271 Transcript_10806/m.16271 type:complete len:321 (-) Transcript_10806:203-1165(-)|eukprot:CAMPEP_0202685510 /NCGR_PEP_ID=MMETSP1385-20130828/1299_1 /ASSEMBLY_ACC=CAM_ASM_000861 /TAXON_ID=933848 /ORGANISM="Elphidium margaritaceum" /LENGTH=320 /DNA_ID=CAMNT_0049339881 /DNA_START=153 /DNA_END=1115 /DNA_ORIENTATION=+
MAEESSTLRKFLKAQDIFDPDVESLLSSLNVKDPEKDFKTFTQEQWDELYRLAVVERAATLKDQKAKVNMEKKMTKLEKYWREQSGLKKTSIKPDSKAAQDDEKKPEDQSSAAATQELLEKADALKKFMQEKECYNIDLLAVLSNHGVNKEEDINVIQTNMEWNTITREVRVAQRGKTQDQAAKARVDKITVKFEKLWRQKTGIKSTSIKDTDKEKEAAPKDKKIAEMQGAGKPLKDWMKKNGIFQMALFEELLAVGVKDENECKSIKEAQFDEIVRKVRVERFKDLKDTTARQNADKLLVKFEKFWRKETGIKKTSVKK